MTKVDCFKKFFLKILLQFTVLLSLATGHSQMPNGELEPEFLAPLENLTVTQGRDVSFTCVANNLGEYRVAWIKSDSKAILAIHTHMVALNPRLSVTHNGHNTWKLHISHVQLNDSGSYMCQVNTDPMRSQSGYLSVVVPPDILNQPDTNSATQEEGITPEGGTVQLVCSATGVPMPSVQWRREGGKDIVLRNEGRDKQVIKHVDGERLTLHNVQRTDMGAYLCIASNGVPPSVSKRFDVKVIFVPVVRVVNQLVAAPVDRHVLLQCVVEAYPKPLNGWYRHDGTKIYEGPKYQMTEGMINSYTWQMNLTVRNLQFDDFHSYVCSSINGLGKSEARIRLQELRLPPTSTTTPTPYVYTTAKPRRKATQSHIKAATFDVPKIKETVVTNHVQENEIAGAAFEVFTQVPVRTGIEKTRNTQMPAAVPSRRTPWINLYNRCSSVTHFCNYCLLLVLLPALVRYIGLSVS
ncbi:lachesin isoform X1 [Phlebotomus papatasi]|uniref:lachesin isoform X1 n=1 Tax=Phlebotomus papatasi TaxID=29031 RepID=UPI002483A94A|nr:lachesin isoform X1 [Phlebotomus papatasi]XP_055711593.1 lachesin isoform X1 [Phlebotomus papatasi]XP_055711595.1 lachesin isoform X1 [Phlebotomus papatasi]